MTEKTSDYMLKVTRFNSSDVIATSGNPVNSGTCTSHSEHYKIVEDLGSGWKVDQYNPETGKWEHTNKGIYKKYCPPSATAGCVLGWCSDTDNFEFCYNISP